MFDVLVESLGELATWQNFMWANFGVFIGIIMGAIPGLTVALGVILFLPITFGMNPVTAIVMLLSLYLGGCYGGSISAILINTPGTNSALATTLDGYPLTRKGKPNKALKISLFSSVIGGFLSAIVLLIAAPPIAKLALAFGPAEYFSLAIFGLSVIAGVSGKSMLKGLISGALGMFISMIGLDIMTGTFRFSFGTTALIGGIPLFPAVVGFIALSEIIIKSVETSRQIREQKEKYSIMSEEEKEQEKIAQKQKERKKSKEDKLSPKEFLRCLPTIIKSSFISIFIGAMPGAGGGIAQFVSYNEAKRVSKKKHEFGKGSLEGIAAAESSNNAVVGSAMIPLITLGIPGDGITAILLGAFIMQGLVPGPTLFTEQAPMTYAIIIGLIVCNIFLLIQGFYLTKVVSKIITVPYMLLAPILMIFCFTGTFASSGNIYELIAIVPIAIFSYIIRKLDFSVVPILLGLILGPIMESNLRRTMVLSEGSWSIFVTRPISLAFLIVAAVCIFIFVRMNSKENNMLTEGAELLKKQNETSTNEE